MSRDAQLRDLAAWCWATATDDEAAALWAAASGFRSARHLSLARADPDAVRPDQSWWTAPPVRVSTMLRERGQAPSPGRPAPVRDDAAARAVALRRQVAIRRADAEAAAGLVDGPLADRTLDREGVTLLLRLLDRALQSRTVVSGRVTATGSAAGVRLRLRPDPAGSVVRTVDGTLALPDVALELEPVTAGARA